MRRLLMDHRRFQEVLGPDAPSLLIDTGPGVSVRVQEGSATSSHTDHTPATLAEVGTPLDHPLVTPTRKVTFRAMLEQSLREFSLNAPEYEWSALAYVLFLEDADSWRTSEGQEVNFDRLAERIMREELPNGTCYGASPVHAGGVPADRRPGADLVARGAARVGEFLQETTARLVRHQHVDGFWNGRWPDSAPTKDPTDFEGDRREDRVLTTAHMLEWWAIAPAEVHPPRHVLVAAGQWLVRALDGMTDEQVKQGYNALTHMARGLALWRGRLPSEVPLGTGETAAKPPAAEPPAAQ